MDPCQSVKSDPELEQHKRVVYIRNKITKLALDGLTHYVRAQPLCSRSPQGWLLECVGYGKYLIINSGTGKVLDLEYCGEDMAKLITTPRDPSSASETQQWYIHSDGLIVSADDGKLVVDITNGIENLENTLIAYPKEGNRNQVFIFEYA